MGNIIGCAADEVEIGLPATVTFQEVEPNVVLPQFMSAGPDG